VGAATVAGLAAAGYALKAWLSVSRAEAGGRLPFWFDDSFAPTTAIYVVALALLGAAIAGVTPALKVTGRGLESRLRQAAAAGGGLRFGGLWTAVIVMQVAVTVAFPATAFFVRRSVVQIQSLDVGFQAEEFLSARFEMDREIWPDVSAEQSRADLLTRFRAARQEVQRRLEAEPGVAGVTFTSVLPRTRSSASFEISAWFPTRATARAFTIL
jgi:putative ABC transport system permease protein